MKTVHLIFNAHLDPVWLWSWRDGLDEVLNTSYYICDLLDRHPDITYTRGEAWVYEKIREIDPALFERVRQHIRAGRWNIVGGWYIQPDCNLPSAFAMERQIQLGKDIFQDCFGQFPRIAYNVDSFGHAAALPELMRRFGQTHYVMMRPQENEMKLSARIFRWRGYADGPEVTVFRIAGGYHSSHGITEEHIRASLTELPEEIADTMCFVGVGDHGGGPTESMIAWCREHQDSFEGIRLEFSSPEKFFSKIETQTSGLPLVTGELQQHAIGCYSVLRRFKSTLRRAEHQLARTEEVLRNCGATSPNVWNDVRKAWKDVCFNHFHDTLGGTCLPSAYADAEAQLGRALAIADETSTLALRKWAINQGTDPAQRLLFLNASPASFDDFVEIEPWLEWTRWHPDWRLENEEGAAIPYQVIEAESGWDTQVRLLFPLHLKAKESASIRIVEKEASIASSSGEITQSETLLQTENAALDLEQNKMRGAGPDWIALPQLTLFTDVTDTWSHGVDRFARSGAQPVVWDKATVLDRGPLMASLVQRGTIGTSRVRGEWRLYHGRPWIEWRLHIIWVEMRQLLKLDWQMPSRIVHREDGIMGGSLARASDGRELPLRDWTRMELEQNAVAAVVAPDVFSLDGDATRVGLTLLRSPVMACHDPNPGNSPRALFSDQGEHFFRFRFFFGKDVSPVLLEQVANHWQRPPHSMEVTRGMKNRALNSDYKATKTS
jgi:alpha-mannosidase